MTARQYENAGDWQRACEVYLTLVSRFPENDETFFHCLELCSKIKRFDQAIELINQKKRIKPNDIHLDVLAAQMVHRSGKVREAQQMWYRILEAHPQDEWAVVLVANAQAENGILNQAVETYLYARRRMRKPYAFGLNLALLYETGLRYENAAAEWMKHLEIHPDQIPLVESHLVRYPALERVVRGVDGLIRKAAESHPRNAEYLGLLIRYETRFGLFGEAFETALLIEEGNREEQRGVALFRFAQEAFQAGGIEPAQKAYEFFLKRFPSFRQLDVVLFNLSRCYAGSERYRESVGVLDELIRRFPQSRLAANALLEKGLLERDPLRRPDQAASTFQKLLNEYSLSRECDRVRFELIDCYILQNDLHQARAHCQQTVRLASSMDRSIRVKADFYLSELDFFMGDFIQASSRLDSLFRTHFGVEETQDPVLNDALSLSMLSKILAKADSEGRSIFAGGMLAMRQKRIDQAVMAFDRIVKTPAAYPSLVAEALYQNGLALLSVDRYPDGIVCFKRLLEGYPGHIHAERALERLGYAQEKSGEIQNALKTYEAFIETFPRSVLSDEVRKRIRKMDEESS